MRLYIFSQKTEILFYFVLKKMEDSRSCLPTLLKGALLKANMNRMNDYS